MKQFWQKLRFLKKGLFWKSVALRFYKVKGSDAVVILSYTSLLSLVPLLGLMLSIFSVSELFQSLSKDVLELLVAHLLPQSGETIQHYLWQFSQQVAKLQAPSLVFILITTLVLLWTIDDKLNSIWSSQLNRRWWVSLLHYLGISLLGPVLLGSSLLLSSYLTAFPLIHQVQNWVALPLAWLHVLPVLFNFLGFAFLFRFVPIVPVSWSSAIIGAGLAALLVEALKTGFALYLAWFPTYSLIYGAFAAVPILLLWIYSLWAVILLCATVVFQLENFARGSTLKSTMKTTLKAQKPKVNIV